MAAMVQGSKGEAAKPRPAREAPDSLHSTAVAKVLDLLGEGEIGGLVDGLRSVYLDETPIQAADGSMNFTGVTLETRNGTQDQRYIAGFPSVDSEISVGVELTAAVPWVRALNNPDLSAVRVRLSLPRLLKSNTSNGDTNGHRVEYAIDLATDGGAFVEVLAAAFDGKTTSKYERSHRVELPEGAGWLLRVRRLTPNASGSDVADKTYVEAVTEVIDAKLRYPNSALVGLTFDAAQFSGVPSRAYHARGRIVRVPSNYDTSARTYNGVWDGTFKPAWTNNPAWVYYDLLLHTRYGLGDRITSAQVDKWALYQIAQYCDQMVPDGKGGLEPRFTCFLYYQTRTDALKVLQDLASIFRGITYWAGGSVVPSADMPVDPVATFANADVLGGKFSYSGSARKTRYTVALVSWNDPTDFGRRKVEYVPDREGIARYGVRQTEVNGLGCSSQGQAQRLGRWALLTSRLETESVVFAVGLDGAIVRPGQVIRVADARRAGRRIGGRLSAVTADTATLDGDVTVAPGDRLIVTLPTGRTEVREVAEVTGRTLRVTVAFSAVPVVQSVWAVESDELVAQQFRVVRVAEQGANALTYEITAVKHVAGKFGAVDSLTKIDAPPISVLPPSIQPPPTAVVLEGRSIIEQGAAVGVLAISWAAAASAVAYEVDWRRDSGEWVYGGRTGGLGLEVVGIYAGRYVARVRAINALDVGSLPATSAETQIAGKTTPPPAVTTLTTEPRPMALGLAWGFPQGVAVADTQRTEIWYSQTTDRASATKLGDFAYPQATHAMVGLAAGATFHFWARLVDRTGNVGPWYPEGVGVMGQSSSDATELLEYLAGQIGETELAAQLLGRIGLIDAGVGVVGSVAQRVAAERAERTAALAAEALARTQAVQNEAQARADAVLGEAQARGAAVTQEAEARESGDSSLSSRIDTATAAIAGNAAAIQTEQTARATAVSAEATARSTLAAQLRGSYSGSSLSGVAGGLLYQERTARENGDESLAQQITLLSAGAGEQFDYQKIWYFDSSVEGWTGNGAPTLVSGWLRPANHATDPYVLSPAGMAVTGSQYGQLRLRVRKTGAPVWGGQLRWVTTAAPTFDDARMVALPEPTFDGNGIGLVTVNVPWGGLTIDRVRLDLSSAQAAATGYEVDWIAVGRPSPGASAAALSSEQTARATADAALASDIQSLSASFQGQDGELRALITGEAQARATADTALATRVDGVFAQVNPTLAGDTAVNAGSEAVLAGVWSEQSARAEEDLALGERIDAVTAQVGSVSAAVTSEQTARATADDALGQRIDTVTAQANGTAAGLQTEQTARANADTALGQRIDTVTAQANGTAAGLQTEQTARATADTALGQRIDTVTAQANGTAAGLQTEQTARANADTALGQRIDTVTAQANGTAAGLQTEQTARANADTALGQRIDTVQATAGQNAAAVQQVSTAQAATDGKLTAMWSVKLAVTSDGKYYAAGMGIGIENTPAGMQSQVLFQADRFAVINTANGSISTPFVIQGGQVFINSAVIGDSTITTAKIASALQSTDYVAGQSGWRLTKSGQFELNAAVAGQGRMAITNRAVKVYDGAGVLRVQLGDLEA